MIAALSNSGYSGTNEDSTFVFLKGRSVKKVKYIFTPTGVRRLQLSA